MKQSFIPVFAVKALLMLSTLLFFGNLTAQTTVATVGNVCSGETNILDSNNGFFSYVTANDPVFAAYGQTIVQREEVQIEGIICYFNSIRAATYTVRIFEALNPTSISGLTPIATSTVTINTDIVQTVFGEQIAVYFEFNSPVSLARFKHYFYMISPLADSYGELITPVLASNLPSGRSYLQYSNGFIVPGTGPLSYTLYTCGNGIADTDGDGVADEEDNCPSMANADQMDTDGDGEGDVCDATPNGEGVTSFTLINTVTNMPVAGYDPIPDGANIDLASFGNSLTDFNIRANTDGDDADEIDDVAFTLTRGTRSKSRTESAAPYAIFGDRRGNYQRPNRPFQSVINHGTGDLSIEAYPIYDDGSVGDTYSINFTLSDGANPLREFEEMVSMEIYPNPSSGSLIISGEIVDQTPGTLSILNPMGQVVYRQEISDNFVEKVDLSKYAKGLYLVKVEGKGFNQVGKLILE